MAHPDEQILLAYNLEPKNFTITNFGSGLINNTWVIKNSHNEFILQCINSNIFFSPESIAENTRNIGNYLAHHFPQYLFITPVKTASGKELVRVGKNEYYRMFPFVKNSHTINKADDAKQAFEAAKQFGKFTALLAGFNIDMLHITLKDFHNLSLRYQQFETALLNGNDERKKHCDKEIEYLIAQKNIVQTFEYIKTSAAFKKRVTHHDTKISNILFDENDNGICVIDLDTVMPGYFISDVGDMMRTFLCPVTEEEKDFSLISVRKDFFEAIVKGYLTEMKNELSHEEKDHIFYAGSFMIYMQALRFLTDYLNNDIYYGAKYAQQNFVRAGNQIVLLQQYLAAATQLKKISENAIASL